MTFNRDGFRAPEALTRGEFLLRPIRPSDADLDYEAVMESREFLRTWEQSHWPEDSFTVEGNRRDLERLRHRHANGESFTYTVMNTLETQCLGCVYIFPSDARPFTKSQISALDRARWSTYKAAVYFWIRKSRLADALDRRLLDALRPWLRLEWRIEDHLIVTNERLEQQVAMIENAGLKRLFQIKEPEKPASYLAYV